jgi:two-component system phosphate regulon sensor histidine kinase PhoR
MRLMWRIYFYFLTSALLVLGASAWYAGRSVHQFHQAQVATELGAHARIIARELEHFPLAGDAAAIEHFCRDMGAATQSRITIVAPDGRVLGDSEASATAMENHRNRPEIAGALGGQAGESVRFSDTLRRRFLYLAVPVMQGTDVVAVVRTSRPLATINEALCTVYRHVLFGGLAAAAVFAVVAFYLSRRISRPMEAMRRVAEQLARGDMGSRLMVTDDTELGVLARALNQMAIELDARMQTIMRQANEQQAVFSSMAEGVLAVDREERILHMNDALARWLDVRPDQARGKGLQEVVRHPELQRFVSAVLASGGRAEAEIVVYGGEDRILQLHGTLLAGAAGEKMGALVVLSDVTRLKRLELMRRDFVANVSHELKTPITAIKGCMETLSGDACRSADDTRRFLGMMERQVERLGMIVEDLLGLSRIEHDAEHDQVVLAPGPVRDVLERAVQTFSKTAAARGIAMVLDCPGECAAVLNAELLEQAVGNLIDNAVKYSPDGAHVCVMALPRGEEVEIRVSDDGPGIEKKHLSRIFERFYRVDRARSRTLGGTGLGLSIVRHIALAHHGSVAVESTAGKGSVFIIRLPRA